MITLLPFLLSITALTYSSLPEVPHLDPEMTGFEYRELIEHQSELREASALDRVLRYGKRNLDWFEKLNGIRPAPLELWTEANTVSYPIDQPSLSNEALILERFNAARLALPPAMRDALDSNGELPSTLDVADDIYLEHARTLDRVYQSASRWTLQSPMLYAYAARQQMDVRAYIALKSDLSGTRASLSQWSSLTESERSGWLKKLIQICWNSGPGMNACRRTVDNEIQEKGHPLAFFERHLPLAREFYEEQFQLGATRDDVKWSAASPTTASIPFAEPATSEVRSWLEENIENEWKWNGWGLKLAFQSGGFDVPFIQFVPGATANVNGLGGNRITMDANRPIHHYSSRWTIRHEFGHVLGFPDCYIEFYDQAAQVMVNYQLDVSNLMCSRRGKLKEIHFEEMKRAYLR